jgi:hypothetical protein
MTTTTWGILTFLENERELAVGGQNSELGSDINAYGWSL